MVFNMPMVNVWMTLLMNKCTSALMDVCIYWPKPYLLLSSSCDEMLSWMLETWMKNHLVSDNNCNIVDL